MYSLSAEPQDTKPRLGEAPAALREIELKLRVPAAAVQPVRNAVDTAAARTQRLQARYFDTPDRRLAAAGIALRLRKEGTQWVQTLKSRGDGLMARGEHEVAVGRARVAPALDPTRHAGTAAGAALCARWATTRPHWSRPSPPTSAVPVAACAWPRVLVELAFDEGEIRAGEARFRLRTRTGTAARRTRRLAVWRAVGAAACALAGSAQQGRTRRRSRAVWPSCPPCTRARRCCTRR